MVEYLLNLLGGLSVELKLILMSMAPVVELRGAIPVGIAMGVEPLKALTICMLGSLIPTPFILFGVRPVFKWLKRTKLFRKLINNLSDKTLRRSKKVKKYGFWGLLIFVATPLPGTGVWSGTLAAALLNMRFKVAFPAIVIGNFIAGVIVTLLSSNLLLAF